MFSSTSILCTFETVILLFVLLFFLESHVFFLSKLFQCVYFFIQIRKRKKEGKKRKGKRERATWSLTAFPLKTSGKKKHFALCGYPNKLIIIKYVDYDFAQHSVKCSLVGASFKIDGILKFHLYCGKGSFGSSVFVFNFLNKVYQSKVDWCSRNH